MDELELKSKMQDVILKHARNSGDYLPDYEYEKTINDLYKLFKESVPAETHSYASPASSGVQTADEGVVCHIICKNPNAHRMLMDICNLWHSVESNSMFIDWEQSLSSYRIE